MDSVPGGSNCEEICITRKTLVDYYRECNSRNNSERMKFLHEKLKTHLRTEDLTSDLKIIISKLIYNYRKKLEKYNRNYELCLEHYNDWFDTYITFPVKHVLERKRTSSGGSGGRPSKDFEECSERTKRKRTEAVRKDMTAAELAFAAQMEYRAKGEIGKSKMIKEVATCGSPKTSSESHVTLSSDKALSLVIETQLTKFQYNLLRNSALKVNCNLYPNYESVIEAKKKCYPVGIMCTETCAEVPVQNLMDHTANRLLLSLSDVIETLTNHQKQNLCLLSKWGCDGSGSHSQYKQRFSNFQSSDEYMFITSIGPVRLTYTESNETVLVWQNPRPSSPRYCRPLRLQMAHETSELSILEAANVRNQIKSLTLTSTEEWSVKHEMKMTMVDGKMINAITGTSSAMRCYLCGATSKDFNKLKFCLNKSINELNLDYGICSLHAWIRFTECILHLSYKLKFAKWQARSAREKEIVAAEKKRIQKEIWEKLGLHVDKPRQGGGTSTDGNTARMFFQNPEKVAEITGVHVGIIKRFQTILNVLSSGYKINVEKFRIFCLRAASSFVMNYPWFNMPTTLHKILLHGYLIIQNMGVAIGLLGEDAQESRNKDIRKYRLQFSRKFSRTMTMGDTYHRLLVSSDPYITGLRKLTPKKSISLSPLEISLLDENV